MTQAPGSQVLALHPRASTATPTSLQVWRLITTFLFFGPLGFGFFFNMLFVYPGPLWWGLEVG